MSFIYKQVVRCLAVLSMITCIFGGTTITAQAADDCGIAIVDDGGLFHSDQMAAVQQSVADLSSKGADVRVRTMKDYGSHSSLDSWMAAKRSDCKGTWSNDQVVNNQAPGTLMKGNMVVIGVRISSTPGQSAVMIYYGSDWKPSLANGETTRIQNEVMIPYFKNKDYAGGVSAGLQSVGDDIYGQLHPQKSGGDTTINQAPDLSGLWQVFGWIIGLLAVGALGYFVVRLLNTRRKLEVARVTARGEAMRLRDATSNLLAGINSQAADDVRTVKLRELAAAGDAVEGDPQGLATQYSTAVADASLLMQQAATLYEGADNQRLTTEQYRSMTPVYSDALDAAKQAKGANDQIEAMHRKLREEISSLPATIAAIQGSLTTLASTIEQFTASGYSDGGLTSDVDRLGDKVASYAAASPSITLVDQVADAHAEQQELQGRFTDLHTQVQKAISGVEALDQATESARSKLPDAKESFERVSTTYAPDSWQAIAGNGTEAEKRFSAADASIAQAKQVIANQQWSDALKILEAGNTYVSEGVSLLLSITDRESFLADARENVSGRLDSVQADIDKAAGCEQRFDSDIQDSHKRDIRDARDLLDQARSEAGKQQPNYLRVVELTNNASKVANDAYAACSSEHEAAERLRQQAVDSVQLAEASISKANDYIKNHASDVGKGAHKNLERAKVLLSQAHVEQDLARIIGAATDALSEARKAYNKATSDFTDAESERASERRRRREREAREERSRSSHNNTVIMGSYGSSSWGSGSSPSSSSSWDSGSGSSSSFGSFGGSDSGGGSSSSW